jgi:hypothetical protein
MQLRWPWQKKRAKPKLDPGQPKKRKTLHRRTKAELIEARTKTMEREIAFARAQERLAVAQQRIKAIETGDGKQDDLHIELGDLRRIDKMLRPLGMKIMTEKGGDG